MSLSTTEDCLEGFITWNSYALVYIKCCSHLTHRFIMEVNFFCCLFYTENRNQTVLHSETLVKKNYTGAKWSTYTLCKEDGMWFSLNRKTFSEIGVFIAEAITAAFHNGVPDKFKCLSHVDYIAYTAVHAFPFRSLCTCSDITARTCIMLFFPASLGLKF